MQIRTKKFLWPVIVLLVVGVIGWLLLGGKSTGEAERYKAELRAKGEKISFADLGFPKPPEDGVSLIRLTNAVNRIRNLDSDPDILMWAGFLAPGRMQVDWRSEDSFRGRDGVTMPWKRYGELVRGITNELSDIRLAAEKPIHWFQFDPAANVTNSTGFPMYPFVELRFAAQWLYADGIEALHIGDLARGRQNHHTLLQLTELNREDPTLVAAMIRVAITGLTVDFAWQLLQHTNWTEADLLAMQRDWERVDMLEAAVTGYSGECALAEMFFAITRERGVGWDNRVIPAGARLRPWEWIRDTLEGMMWSPDEDELLMLRHDQGTLESLRALRAGQAWSDLGVALQRQRQGLDKAIGNSKGINRFRFQLSAIVIPNTSKAVQTAVRSETLRRLAVAAVALKRFQLRHQRLPEKLDELVPDFLASMPIDCMNSEPLRYRREGEADFVLYSVGEDGKDDGGDPTPTAKVSQNDWWTGRDVAWPKPAN